MWITKRGLGKAWEHVLSFDKLLLKSLAVGLAASCCLAPARAQHTSCHGNSRVGFFFLLHHCTECKTPEVSRLLIQWRMRSGADMPTAACPGTIVKGINSVCDVPELLSMPAPMWACSFGPFAAPTTVRAPGWSLLTQPKERPGAKLWPSCHMK